MERERDLGEVDTYDDLLVAGHRELVNKQVGGDLGISEITVKAHRGKLMRKMQAASFAELENMAASLHRGAPPSGGLFA